MKCTLARSNRCPVIRTSRRLETRTSFCKRGRADRLAGALDAVRRMGHQRNVVGFEGLREKSDILVVNSQKLREYLALKACIPTRDLGEHQSIDRGVVAGLR